MRKLSKSNSFTLIEVLFSSAIGILALFVSTTVIIQVYDIFRETTTENKLGQYSDIIKKTLERKFQLSEAVTASIESSSPISLMYTVADRSTPWPDPENQVGKNIQLQFSQEEENIFIVVDNEQKKELAKDDLKITNCTFEYNNDEKEPIITIFLEYNIEIGDQKYYRQEEFDVIVTNGALDGKV